jgi:hypothetical protein
MIIMNVLSDCYDATVPRDSIALDDFGSEPKRFP